MNKQERDKTTRQKVDIIVLVSQINNHFAKIDIAFSMKKKDVKKTEILTATHFIF